MKKFLIVNADDFGLEEEINSGVIHAHCNGLVTTASLIANGAAFENAVALARENPELDIGAHLTLTRGPSLTGQPLLDPVEVPSLVRGDNFFPQSPVTLSARIALGFVSPYQIQRELRAQIEKIHSAGIRITHLDSHQHIHMVPSVFRQIVGLAREFDVKWVRLPRKHPRLHGVPPAGIGQTLKRMSLSMLSELNKHGLKNTTVRSADYYLGLDYAGRLVEEAIGHIVRNVPAGTTELSCHPGSDDIRLSRNHPWGFRWQQELAALCSTSVREALDEEGIELTSYSRLAAP